MIDVDLTCKTNGCGLARAIDIDGLFDAHIQCDDSDGGYDPHD